jgi:endonuclease III
MTKHTQAVRGRRVARMNRILDTLYPTARIELYYTTHFECFVAVLLSAQCTDIRVNKVTETLFKKYPTVEAFARARQKDMEKAVFSCGFYRNKAKNIIAAARVVLDDFNGELPDTFDELTRLPGGGRKTVNVVLSSLFGKTEGIAVDTHVRRFAIRFDLSDYTDPKRIEKDLMAIMPQKYWWSFNHRLVHYGRHCCNAYRHDCHDHPLTKVYPKANKIWPRADGRR